MKRSSQGLAEKEGTTEKDVDPKELAMGIAVEREHTQDEALAKQIALDHLTEFSNYYTHLKKMEEGLKSQKRESQLGWKKAPSVTGGGKAYFWYIDTPASGRMWVVWNRQVGKWVVVGEQNKILAKFETDKEGRRYVEDNLISNQKKEARLNSGQVLIADYYRILSKGNR